MLGLHVLVRDHGWMIGCKRNARESGRSLDTGEESRDKNRIEGIVGEAAKLQMGG